jgi:hypothetical protein
VSDPIYTKFKDHPNYQYRRVRFVANPIYVNTGRFGAVPDPCAMVHFSNAGVYGDTYLPQCVVEAKYMINYALLRGHTLAGITLCAKNHFGSLYRPACADGSCGTLSHGGWTPSGPDLPNKGLHGWINPFDVYYGSWNLPQRPMGSYNVLVDLMGHRHLGGKTLLFLIDGLYGSIHQGATVSRFASFGNDWCSSLFIAQDGVALDSVALDFLRYESTCESYIRGDIDNYLHEAALADDPCSGTFYDPEGDGTRLASLGVHEHWNNVQDKQYSCNLGRGEGIDLIAPHLIPKEALRADSNGDKRIDFADLIPLVEDWLEENTGLAGDLNGDTMVDLQDLGTLGRYYLESFSTIR